VLSLEYPALLARKTSYWQLLLPINLRYIGGLQGSGVVIIDKGMVHT
jgi:hypothetical protein